MKNLIHEFRFIFYMLIIGGFSWITFSIFIDNYSVVNLLTLISSALAFSVCVVLDSKIIK